MGLETGTQIGDLVPANPLGTDPKSQGDDHLRLIKTCVQGSLGNMESFWEIPTIGPGLSQKNTAGSAAVNLINLVSGDFIEIGQSGIPSSFFGNVSVIGGNLSATGTLLSGGALTVSAGGASITGDVGIDGDLTVINGGIQSANALTVLSGGLTVTGALSTINGALNIGAAGNLQLSSGGNFFGVGSFMDFETLPSELGYSIKLKRTGSASGNFLQMTNDGAAATYRPIAFMVHDDAGAIRMGSSNVTNTFVILENTIRLGDMPSSPSGLTQGDLYHTFGQVFTVL